ncbi:MAG: sugar phosphate isomerase/epimerase family protein [Akkermansiaceae bacterium]
MFTKFIPIVILLGSMGQLSAQGNARSFYAFQNGLGFGSEEEQAIFLKKAGYHGVSQSKKTGEALQKQIDVYQKHGLSVLSVYLDASEKPVKPELFSPLAKAKGMVELTVRKSTPNTVEAVRETAESAEKLGIKVALYPHHGFVVATTNDAMELIRKVDHPNLGVMFNLCHFLKNEDPKTLEEAIGKIGPKLYNVSISGADTGGKDWGALIKPLGEGDFPVSRVLSALDEIKYTGPVTLQCYAVKGDKKENLANSFEAWKKLNQ